MSPTACFIAPYCTLLYRTHVLSVQSLPPWGSTYYTSQLQWERWKCGGLWRTSKSIYHTGKYLFLTLNAWFERDRLILASSFDDDVHITHHAKSPCLVYWRRALPWCFAVEWIFHKMFNLKILQTALYNFHESVYFQVIVSWYLHGHIYVHDWLYRRLRWLRTKHWRGAWTIC